MADFTELKGAVLSTLGTVAVKTRDLAEKAADKAKDVTKLAKLTMELNSEKDTLQKTYAEIGKLYYDTRKNDPDNFFIQLCEEVKVSTDNVARLQVELDELKAGIDPRAESDIEVEFTECPEGAATEEDFVKETPAEEKPAE